MDKNSYLPPPESEIIKNVGQSSNNVYELASEEDDEIIQAHADH